MIRRLTAPIFPKANMATIVVFHDGITSGEKSEKQDLSGWHRFSCSSNCLECLAEVNVKQHSNWCKKILKHLMYVRESIALAEKGRTAKQQRPQFISATLPIIPRITAENKEIMSLFLSSAKRD